MVNLFCRDRTAGTAFTGSVCRPYNLPNNGHQASAIVENWKGMTHGVSINKVLSHELGHTVGMDHNHGWGSKFGHTDIALCKLDFEDQNNGIVSIMRQLEPNRRRVWSICNRCDLLKYYQNQMKRYGKFCMQDNVSNTGPSGSLGTPGLTRPRSSSSKGLVGPNGPFEYTDSDEEYIETGGTTLQPVSSDEESIEIGETTIQPGTSGEEYIESGETTIQPGSSDEFTEQTVDPDDSIGDTTLSDDSINDTTLYPNTTENEAIPKPTEEIDLAYCARNLKGNIKNMIPPKLTFRITVITKK